MAPNDAVIKSDRITVPQTGNSQTTAKPTVRALAEVAKAYAIYVSGGTRAELVLDLPAGGYEAQWVNTRNGKTDQAEDFQHSGGDKNLKSPPYSEDIALRLIRKKG